MLKCNNVLTNVHSLKANNKALLPKVYVMQGPLSFNLIIYVIIWIIINSNSNNKPISNQQKQVKLVNVNKLFTTVNNNVISAASQSG